jgi:ATP-binding cassette subfamily B (MDR/TAP) protein 6
MDNRNIIKASSFTLVKVFLDNLYGPLRHLGATIRHVQEILVEGEEMVALYSKEPAICNKSTKLEFIIDKGEIEFENVTYSYGSGNEILNNLSFRVLPGEMVALVGLSGSGKSTIINLILRFFDPTSGRIKIDGRDITDIKLPSLKNQVGVVPQVNPFMNLSNFLGDSSFQRFDPV